MCEAGAVGVVMFFTLSGFLITSLLLEERTRDGRVSLREFYRRRALRILPALLVTVALATVVALLANGRIADTSLIAGALTFTTNFRMLDGAFPDMGLGHLWSVAVEEQFYILWPLTLLFLVRLPRMLLYVLFTSVSIGTLLLRDHLWTLGETTRIYYGFDTRADSLLIGCAFAIFMAGRVETRVSRAWPVAGSLLVAAFVATGGYTILVLLPLLGALGTVGIIWGAVQGAGLRWLQWGPLRAVGRRSYGLYLLQSVVAVALRPLPLPIHSVAGNVLVMLPLSWLGACLMWRYVELPFLRLKDRSGRTAGIPGVARPAAITAAAPRTLP